MKSVIIIEPVSAGKAVGITGSVPEYEQGIWSPLLKSELGIENAFLGSTAPMINVSTLLLPRYWCKIWFSQSLFFGQKQLKIYIVFNVRFE